MLLMLASAASAQLPWTQGFEDRLPGQTAQGWSVGWGDPGDDLLLTSNLRAHSGQRSLLLDRQTGEQSPMAGYNTRLPNVAERWLAFSVAFLIQGKADSVRFGFELRGANPGDRSAAVAFDGRRVSLISGDFAHTVPLGEYAEDAWSVLWLWLPTSGGAQTEVLARLGSGPLVRVPGKAPASGHGIFMPVTYPGKRGYLLFLDDLRVEAADAPDK
ncbi:MAG: hypothetical protein HZB16_15415 [Armatimonadetes bacterium]|nr:hypothetical protein [Armatimonadota bacterium]